MHEDFSSAANLIPIDGFVVDLFRMTRAQVKNENMGTELSASK
jgi:hypothetical protein